MLCLRSEQVHGVCITDRVQSFLCYFWMLRTPLNQDCIFIMHVFILELMYISDYNSYKLLECLHAV